MTQLMEVQPQAIAPRSGGVELAAQREMAQVQAAVVMAKQFPRDPVAAAERIRNACQRRGLAEGALYSYSRGGTDITGPSIRLAEAVAQNWGNIKFGVEELEQRGGESLIRVYCWDMETNVVSDKTFQVPHVRDTKRGRVNLTDQRDIYEAVANFGARRLRAAILAIVPGDVVEDAVIQCEETLAINTDVSQEGIAKMLKAFADIGVARDQVEARIQRRAETIQPAQVVQLRKIMVSIRDGMSKPSDWFAGPKDEPEPKTLVEQIKERAPKKEKPPEPEKPPKGRMAKEGVVELRKFASDHEVGWGAVCDHFRCNVGDSDLLYAEVEGAIKELAKQQENKE